MQERARDATGAGEEHAQEQEPEQQHIQQRKQPHNNRNTILNDRKGILLRHTEEVVAHAKHRVGNAVVLEYTLRRKQKNQPLEAF